MKRTLLFASALFLMTAALPIYAQNSPAKTSAPPTKTFYHLRFVVEELSATGQITNARSYQTIVGTGIDEQEIKTGSRIPILTSSSGNSSNASFQYIDLGVKIAINRPELSGDSLSFILTTLISSTSPHPETIEGVQEPVIRENSWDSEVLVPLNKPTVVFSSDELDSKGKMQIEVTATPVE